MMQRLIHLLVLASLLPAAAFAQSDEAEPLRYYDVEIAIFKNLRVPKGREYVLRLILRRAARFGRMAGFTGPFLANIAETVIAEMGSHYTELKAREQFIYNVIEQEEARFLTTFEQGLSRLDDLVQSLKAQNQKSIPGEEIFKLHATYGFPFELTRDIARDDHNFQVDETGFRKAMESHRKISGSGSFATIDEARLSVYADLLESLKTTGKNM